MDIESQGRMWFIKICWTALLDDVYLKVIIFIKSTYVEDR